MPKRKTIEEVKEFCANKYGNDIEIISNEYFGNKEPLLVRCKCGNEYYRTFDKIRSGFIMCPQCKKEYISNLYRYDIDRVVEELKKHNCEYVSGDYENNQSKLTVKCSCGNIFTRSFIKIQSGQDKCLDCSKKSLIQSKTKYTSDDARKIFQERGYTMIGEYVNCETKVKCLCAKNHICYLTISGILQNRSGCKQCSIDRSKGKNSSLYKGGVSKTNEAIRNALKKWRDSIRELYNDTCPISGLHGEKCVVHHLTTLRTIYNDVSKEYDSDVIMNSHIRDFDDYNVFDKIKSEVLKRHDNETGILISRKIHSKYHKIYGKTNNTPEQFDEFLRNEYSIPLKEILRGNNYGL